jgi:CheY-like chemotaxis protein
VPLNKPSEELKRTELPDKFILCGEDDKDDEDLLAEIFSGVDKSFALYFVNNGRKLVSTLHTLPDDKLPCLLVLDYNMPELNGAEILRTLREEARYANIPKVIWSTSGADLYKQMCLNLGALNYVIKPSNMRELQEVVKYMISLCR